MLRAVAHGAAKTLSVRCAVSDSESYDCRDLLKRHRPTSKFSNILSLSPFQRPEKMCGTDGTNGTNGTSAANVCSGSPVLLVKRPRILISSLQGATRRSNPYQPLDDFLSNV